MGLTLFRLTTAALLPVVVTILFYQADRKGRFGSKSYGVKQTIIGVTFGIIAILATEFGIPVNGAVLNVRNAAPLTAGLIFGWPAGILSGLIGGVERWLSHAGDFTRTACTLGTILAGIFGAAVRKFMMGNKKASWFYGLAVGVVTEVFHMLMVFLTNMNVDIQRAVAVIQIVAIPMILFNGLSVMLSIMAVTVMSNRKVIRRGGIQNISQSFQQWLLVCVLLAFSATSTFTYSMQTSIARASADEILLTNAQDVKKDVEEASDRNLMRVTRAIAADLPDQVNEFVLDWIAAEHGVTEINIVNEAGFITASTNGTFVGFDMSSGWQSGEFLALLRGQKELVQSYQPITYDQEIYRKYAGVALPEGGFLQVGYDASRFQEDIDEEVILAARNRHVGQEGFIVVCDESGRIVSAPDGHEEEYVSLGGHNGKAFEEGKGFEAEVFGEPSCCMYVKTEGYVILSVIPKSEAMFGRDAGVYILAFMEVVVFAALFAHIFFLIKKLVVENIQKINESLSQITGGNLDVTVDVRTNEEFASLSDDINTTVVTLKHYIDEAAARIDKELEFAKQIQHSSLPSVFPPYPNRKDFSIYATMDTAKEVGGDFYDFYFLEPDRIAFLIADVSGKGIPAAMFMMTAKTIIKGLAESGMEVNEIFTRANAKLCEGNDAGMFVTAWMGVLDLQTGLLQYTNAGHNPPVIRHKDGEYEYLKSRANFILAGMDGVKYRKAELQLQPGDEIYLYTDGVTEAQNLEHELFGEDRLLMSLNEKKGLSVEEICKKVKQDVDAFVGEADQFDDITMLSVKLSDKPRMVCLELTPDNESVVKVTEFLEQELERREVPLRTANKLMIAMDEIYSNIVRYSGAKHAEVRCGEENGSLVLVFRDDGTPYNPLDAKDPDITLSAEERGIGGLGIFMVRKMMDSVDYMYKSGHNILTLTLGLSEEK